MMDTSQKIASPWKPSSRKLKVLEMSHPEPVRAPSRQKEEIGNNTPILDNFTKRLERRIEEQQTSVHASRIHTRKKILNLQVVKLRNSLSMNEQEIIRGKKLNIDMSGPQLAMNEFLAKQLTTTWL